MPDVADYRVIRDGSVTIDTGADPDKEFDFNLGTEVRRDQNSILAFFARSDASNLSFEFLINGNSIRTIHVKNGNLFASIHEIVGGGKLKDLINKLKVRIVNGSGSATISDIVLFVQRKV
jgi:hypothetical protein